MKEINGGVCAPKGFQAGGIRCGLKESSQKKDLALLYSQNICNAAAVFTTNKVKAASIIVSQESLADGKLRAIIANSGNANACTGQAGLLAAQKMAQLAADALLIDKNEVAVASTGVIGVPLPILKIENNIGILKNSLRGDEQGHKAALEAIMTTDTHKKEIAVEIKIEGIPVRIGAMTKGSGMIAPNMATMLCFITTDAAIAKDTLNTALSFAVKKSFNQLVVDGDMSTNDTAIIMANGNAGNTLINTVEDGNYHVFYNALEYVCIKLAKEMARDGEGASKLVTVTVKGSCCKKIAGALAKSVVSSSLVKTACFGADANWGRVLCAMGYAGTDFLQDKVDVSFASRAGTVLVCKNGEGISFSEEAAKEILSQEEIEILIDLNNGEKQAAAWGCDLTYDYVKINGDYRS